MRSSKDSETSSYDQTAKYAGYIAVAAILALVAIRVLMEQD